MSLILDALKKAEQDRHAGQAPVLDDVLIQRPRMPPRRRAPVQQDALLVAAMALALLFALSGLAYWLWPSPTARVQASIVPTEAQAPATEPLQAAAPTLRVDAERLDPALADAPESAVELADTGAAQAATLDELDGEAPTRTRPAADAAEVDTPAEPLQAEPAPAVVAASEPAARALKEMPPAFRSEFPRLSVDVHVYDDNPLRRFVLVNGKKYRETDTFVEGPRVIEITPTGVIVEHRGSKVLLELPR